MVTQEYVDWGMNMDIEELKDELAALDVRRFIVKHQLSYKEYEASTLSDKQAALEEEQEVYCDVCGVSYHPDETCPFH